MPPLFYLEKCPRCQKTPTYTTNENGGTCYSCGCTKSREGISVEEARIYWNMYCAEFPLRVEIHNLKKSVASIHAELEELRKTVADILGADIPETPQEKV